MDKVNGRNKRRNNRDKVEHRAREGAKLQYRHGVFHFTFTHHPVPVRSLLDDRLSPDGNVVRQSGKNGEMFLGFGFQGGLAARQLTNRALHYQTRTMRGPNVAHQVEGSETYPVPLHVE